MIPVVKSTVVTSHSEYIEMEGKDPFSMVVRSPKEFLFYWSLKGQSARRSGGLPGHLRVRDFPGVQIISERLRHFQARELLFQSHVLIGELVPLQHASQKSSNSHLEPKDQPRDYLEETERPFDKNDVLLNLLNRGRKDFFLLHLLCLAQNFQEQLPQSREVNNEEIPRTIHGCTEECR